MPKLVGMQGLVRMLKSYIRSAKFWNVLKILLGWPGMAILEVVLGYCQGSCFLRSQYVAGSIL